MSADIKTVIKGLLDASSIGYSDVAESELAGQTIYSIVTKENERIPGNLQYDLIHAIDLLVKKIVEKQLPAAPVGSDGEERSGRLLFLVDLNNYRTKQIKDLQARALIMAERARSFQYDVELSPMSAYERLIVHATLTKVPNVKTESHGEGRNRRVIIKYTAA